MSLLRNRTLIRTLTDNIPKGAVPQTHTHHSPCRSTLSSFLSPTPKRFYSPSFSATQTHQQSHASKDQELSRKPTLSPNDFNADNSDIRHRGKYNLLSDTKIRWTDEEDKILATFIRNGMSSNEIHQHFPLRSICALDTHISHIREKLLNVKSMTKEEIRAMRRHTNRYARAWTPEEDAWLTERVRQQGTENLDWPKIANGLDPNDASSCDRIGRTATSCQRRWSIINPNTPRGTGRWDHDEAQRLLDSVCSQLGLKESKWSPTFGVLGQEHVEVEQLQKVDWKKVAKAVGTRSDIQCRSRVYKTLRCGEKGRWSSGELERLERGLKTYGQDWNQLADVVATRSAYQVKQKYFLTTAANKG
ncbi:hypothetical protein BGX28_005194 [Mortierella sp. GBA30]|nr:hypothetical protein BGX28_005194 [Mortierella sp. GBA30]